MVRQLLHIGSDGKFEDETDIFFDRPHRRSLGRYAMVEIVCEHVSHITLLL